MSEQRAEPEKEKAMGKLVVTEAEVQLLGRVTYEGFAAAWPSVYRRAE